MSTAKNNNKSISLSSHVALTVGLRGLIVGVCTAVALLLFTVLHTDRFFTDTISHGAWLYTLCLIASVIIGAIAAVRVTLPPRFETIVNTAVVLLLPVVAMTMVECLNGVFTWEWSPRVLMLNYILYLLFYGIVYVFSGSYRLPLLIVNGLFFLLALTNFYVKSFRGTPFVPMDFFAAGTAMNVASSYDFSFNHQVVIAVIMLAFLTVVAARLRTPKLSTIVKIASRIFFSVLAVSIIGIYLFTDLYAQAGLSPDFWSQQRGYNRSGVVLNFCLNTKYTTVNKPNGYDADDIDDIVRDVLGDEQTQATASPNIICIMNESFSDLSVLGNFKTNVEYLPFLNSLTENTVRGNLYVPVIGGSTSNTEFEFLTGTPMSFFPAGSNAYMLYAKKPLYSLVSALGDQHYSRSAFHPYYAGGWNRNKVYPSFGFTRFDTIESIISNRTLIAYQNSGYDATVLQDLVSQEHPDERVLLRQYVSDEFDYKKVIELYEQRDTSKPFFLFNVTMQNHSSYSASFDNFAEDVVITQAGNNPSPAYPYANRYLSLIKASDAAAKDLIAYFKAQSDPTVICLFGDHQPNLEPEFKKDVLGDSVLNLSDEQTQKQYITPFYIWANYDIEEKVIDKLSANYLSSYVMQVAGVKMPTYNRYLLKLSEVLPVINPYGIIDTDGNRYSAGENTPYDELLDGYKKVVYNLIFDDKDKCTSLYTLQ